jgi:hypothetical protein
MLIPPCRGWSTELQHSHSALIPEQIQHLGQTPTLVDPATGQYPAATTPPTFPPSPPQTAGFQEPGNLSGARTPTPGLQDGAAPFLTLEDLAASSPPGVATPHMTPQAPPSATKPDPSAAAESEAVLAANGASMQLPALGYAQGFLSGESPKGRWSLPGVPADKTTGEDMHYNQGSGGSSTSGAAGKPGVPAGFLQADISPMAGLPPVLPAIAASQPASEHTEVVARALELISQVIKFLLPTLIYSPHLDTTEVQYHLLPVEASYLTSFPVQ